ncbi:hypothetical protein E2C01_043096 [Portunus trituberculatus]|uniref:Uncharacterized protein n=1 Tax=Portunus trituberculatus TaxID=210409 RepID=A0A5B7FWK3_PORTR|nr:hypothetical protein [Portunus trituberculatus]
MARHRRTLQGDRSCRHEFTVVALTVAFPSHIGKKFFDVVIGTNGLVKIKHSSLKVVGHVELWIHVREM